MYAEFTMSSSSTNHVAFASANVPIAAPVPRRGPNSTADIYPLSPDALHQRVDNMRAGFTGRIQHRPQSEVVARLESMAETTTYQSHEV